MTTSYDASPLRTARLARGLTQLEVAETLGVTQGYIGRVERGELQPSRARMLELATIYGCSVVDLDPELGVRQGQ